MQLFDRDGNKLLETRCSFDGCDSHEVILEEGERIIGFKSKNVDPDEDAAWHDNFQFVIGKME